MKLWIIYKDGMVISNIIAEMIQDRLEDYIDVSVGISDKIEPSYLLEEKFDYLIIGDTISETIPSMEIRNWLLKYKEVCKQNCFIVKILSGFYITLADINNEVLWIEFLQDCVSVEIINPPILRLKLSKAGMADLNGVLELVKEYSNNFIDLLINNKKKVIENHTKYRK